MTRHQDMIKCVVKFLLAVFSIFRPQCCCCSLARSWCYWKRRWWSTFGSSARSRLASLSADGIGENSIGEKKNMIINLFSFSSLFIKTFRKKFFVALKGFGALFICVMSVCSWTGKRTVWDNVVIVGEFRVVMEHQHRKITNQTIGWATNWLAQQPLDDLR